MQDFSEAFINCEHTVLGKRLKPFCLKHCLYLDAIGSPIMRLIGGEEARITRKDLELAVMICTTEGDPLKALEQFYFPRNWVMRFCSFRRGLRAFQNYIADFVTVPHIWTKSEDGASLKSPWILSKATMLLMKTSMTRKEIWEMPLGELLWYSASIAELEGIIEIQSEAEYEAIKEILEIRKKNENGKKHNS